MYQDHVDYKYNPTVRHRTKNVPKASDNRRHCDRSCEEGSDSTHEKASLEGHKIGEKTMCECAINEGTDTERFDQSTDTRSENGGTCGCHQNGSTAEHDPVNHPAHYTQGGIECIDAIQAAVNGLKGMEAVCVGNVIRYIWRWKWKNGKEDLHKARFYLNKLILLIEGK